MPNKGLTRLIYASRTSSIVANDPKTALSEILAKSIYNNRQLHVTGMLLYHQGYFVQALEGTNVAVGALMQKISIDKRHHCVTVVDNAYAESRAFEGFAMCARALSPVDKEIIDVLKIREFAPMWLSGDSLLKLLTTIHSVHMRVGPDMGPPAWRRPLRELDRSCSA